MLLNEKIKKCEKCPLHKTCSKPIPWDWVFESKIMVIWEAPGAEEDKQGKPFVWRSGKLLTSILEPLWFVRDKDYYITNIVKCRPPDNRDPKDDEINMCSEYLIEQIQTMKPTIIVTLWRFSMNFLLPDLKIWEAHGNIYKLTNLRWQEIKHPPYILPVYHPAVALYKPSQKDTIAEDLGKINTILDRANS